MHPISPPPQSYSRIYRPWADRASTSDAGAQPSPDHNAATSGASPCDSHSSSCSHSDIDVHDDTTTSEHSMDKSYSDTGLPDTPKRTVTSKRLPSSARSLPATTTSTTSQFAFGLLPTTSTNVGAHLTHSSTPLLSFPPTFVGPAAMLAGYPAAFFSPPNAAAAATAAEMHHACRRVLAEEARAKQLSARKQRPKRFVCAHCACAFSNNGQLLGHIRIHTGERPYRCEAADCGKTFTRNEELTRHKRIHTGVRPYACDTCGKRFGRRDHLKKHVRTHLVQMVEPTAATMVGSMAGFMPSLGMGMMPTATGAATVPTTTTAAAAAAVAAAMMPMYPFMFG